MDQDICIPDRVACDGIAASPDPGEIWFCGECSYDLSAVAESARFCPRCGSGVLPPQLPLARVFYLPEEAVQRRDLERFRPLAAHAIAYASSQRRQSILTGYASALYNLGVRYESAMGATRNVDEAVRCYEKAARLTTSL